jgi:hypothetical protein
LLELFEIKYCCEGFELTNNFPYLNFSRLTMDLELKIQRSLDEWISIEKSWNFRI